MNRFSKLLVASIFMLAMNPAAGQRGSELSADLPDARVLQIQQKVERLYMAGVFDRAFLIYRKELAPIGDKYAQYMVGYMYETGAGVDRDLVAASAWYRLASERGTPEFEAVRDKLMNSLEPYQRTESDDQFYELRRRFSDMAVLMIAIRENFDELNDRTGSRLGSESSSTMILDVRTEKFTSASDYYRNVRNEMEARIRLLIDIGDFTQYEDVRDVEVRELERLVRERLDAPVNDAR